MYNLPKKYLFFSILLIISIYLSSSVSATTSVSVTVPIDDPDATAGHIITLKNGVYILSFSAREPGIFGVITDDPIISINDRTLTNSKYVVTSGEVRVKVSGINGSIEEGDYLSASKISGVGQKAAGNGPVIGVALESYNPENLNDVGEISALLNITSSFVGERQEQDLIGLLRGGLQVPFVTPITSFRYILAALIALVSFFIGFSSFGRISINGIEALGRNPLAGKLIKSAIVLNFIFTFGIMAVGLAISYLILSI